MKLHTSIQIKATSTTVWNALMDFQSYSTWNPFIGSIQGEKQVGGKLEVHLYPENGKKMVFKPTVQINEAEKQFQWLGRLILPGIFDGRHHFEIVDHQDGTIEFIHSEEFKGLLVPLMKKQLERETKSDFERMNKALKAHCEAQN